MPCNGTISVKGIRLYTQKVIFLVEPTNSPHVTINYSDRKIRVIPSILGNPTVNHTRIAFPSLTIPTQIDVGYPVTLITTGENVSFTKTTDGQLNQWGRKLDL